MLLTGGNAFIGSERFLRADIEIKNGAISDIRECGAPCADACGETLDANGCFVIPGLVDIHIHGALGADFSDGTYHAAKTIAQHLLKSGVTSFLGTTASLPESALMESMRVAARLQTERVEDGAAFLGVNLEGPFISTLKKGAQNEEYIIPPDIDMLRRLFDASGRSIRLVDAAPEVEGGIEFMRKAARDMTVSVAHSAADYDTAKAAFAAGASHVTHLFNGMSAFLHRDTGVVGAAFEDAAHVELITDGVHISPPMIRAAFTLFGGKRICLVSDGLSALGMPDGDYLLGGQNVLVRGGRANLADGTIAGSTTNLFECMRRAVSYGIRLEDAVRSATKNPCDAIGCSDRGEIAAGKRADLLVLDEKLNIRDIIFDGRRIEI